MAHLQQLSQNLFFDNTYSTTDYGSCVCHQEVEEKIDKICEMASVMRRAIELDEETETHDAELIAQLRHENVSLRSLIRDMDDGRCTMTTMIDNETQVTIEESVVASVSDDTVASDSSVTVATTSCGDDDDGLESVADSGRDTAVSESASTISVCSDNSNDAA